MPKRSRSPRRGLPSCRTTELPIYFLGPEADSIALYEQLFADCMGVYFRYLDDFGDPVVVPAARRSASSRSGSSTKTRCSRTTPGFSRASISCASIFMFPRKFLGFELTGLDRDLAAAEGEDRRHPVCIRRSQRAAGGRRAAVDVRALCGAGGQPVRKDHRPHRAEVEPARISCRARPQPLSRLRTAPPARGLRALLRRTDKVPVQPLYSGFARKAAQTSAGAFYTVRRLPRRRTVEEKRYGVSSDYTGTDMFISLSELAGIDDDTADRRAERPRAMLQPAPDRTVCRSVPAAPIFVWSTISRSTCVCVAGPTPAARAGRAAAAQPQRNGPYRHRDLAPRSTCSAPIISVLSSAARGRNGQALREMLSMFGELSDSVTERRIRGVRSVDSRPIVRRIRQRSGIGAARGIEITVTIDEKAFEGTGIFLLGAVLDRFFAEYSALQPFHPDRDPLGRTRRDHAMAAAHGNAKPL